MIQAKNDLLAALGAAIAEVAPGGSVAAAFESPKQAAHGDLACTAAMPLAKALKKNPREVAAALVEALKRQTAVQRWVEALEIAGPGFINLRLKAAAKQAIVAEVLAAGAQFGRLPATNNSFIYPTLNSVQARQTQNSTQATNTQMSSQAVQGRNCYLNAIRAGLCQGR